MPFYSYVHEIYLSIIGVPNTEDFFLRWSRISNGKWAPKGPLAILSRKMRRVLLKQIQAKLYMLKVVLKRKYCKIAYIPPEKNS